MQHRITEYAREAFRPRGAEEMMRRKRGRFVAKARSPVALIRPMPLTRDHERPHRPHGAADGRPKSSEGSPEGASRAPLSAIDRIQYLAPSTLASHGPGVERRSRSSAHIGKPWCRASQVRVLAGRSLASLGAGHRKSETKPCAPWQAMVPGVARQGRRPAHLGKPWCRASQVRDEARRTLASLGARRR